MGTEAPPNSPEPPKEKVFEREDPIVIEEVGASDSGRNDAAPRKTAVLSRYAALSVSLTPKVSLSQACHHWCRPPGSTAIALAAFLRAAGLDSEFRQATTGVGEPTDNGVREVLLDFYARNHPEYANEEKVARIIRSFKRKAQAQRELPDTAARRWDELLWAGFLREGVDVTQEM